MSESLESITPILYSVGVGIIGGFLVGYIVKKILNLAIIWEFSPWEFSTWGK